MFDANQYKAMYKRFMGPLSQPVKILVGNGTGFTTYSNVMAHVSSYSESDLVPGGTVQLGDLKVIIPWDEMPVAKLTLRDRIEIDGKARAIIHYDTNTRSVGSQIIAAEVTVRG